MPTFLTPRLPRHFSITRLLWRCNPSVWDTVFKSEQLGVGKAGYAILSAEGYETNDEVVFAEPGAMTLLGVRTLEGFGVMVDNIAHRFVATTTLVARSQKTSSIETH